jgi:hypothetical protein
LRIPWTDTIDRLRHATVESPASPASPAYSSPLSPALSELESVEAEPLEQPVNVAAEHGADGVDRATGSSSSSARPTPAAEYTGNDETPTSFACPHCDKSYASEKSFKVSHTLQRLITVVDHRIAPHG